jgi:hypothetical protein
MRPGSDAALISFSSISLVVSIEVVLIFILFYFIILYIDLFCLGNQVLFWTY